MHKFIYVIKYFDIQTKPSSSHMCIYVQINISFLSSDISQCNINVVNIIDSRVHRQRRNEYKHITRPKYLWDFLSGYEIDAKRNFLICQIYWLQVACIRYRWLFIIEWFNNVFFLSRSEREIRLLNDRKVVNGAMIFNGNFHC